MELNAALQEQMSVINLPSIDFCVFEVTLELFFSTH